MARNLLTLFGINLVYNVFQNQTVCPLLRLALHSAIDGEWPGSPVNAQSCVTILSSPVVCVEFCESGLAYTQVR